MAEVAEAAAIRKDLTTSATMANQAINGTVGQADADIREAMAARVPGRDMADSSILWPRLSWTVRLVLLIVSARQYPS